MKRPLALLAGSALLSVALAAPAAALDVPPLPIDQLTDRIEQVTGALGLSDIPAGDTDGADADGPQDKVVGGESRARSDVGKTLGGQTVEKYRAPRNLPKSGSGDSTMLLAIAGLGLIGTGGLAYSAGRR